jgi:hypothetical protein
MGNIMATTSHSNPEPARDDADAIPPSTAPCQHGGPSLSNQPSAPDPIVTTAPPRTPPAAQQTGATVLDLDGATRANALSNMQYVVDLADSVVCVANDLHERILQEIASYNGRTMPDAQKALMRALTDDELLLRQYAHALYANAATFVIHDLAAPQHRLMALTTEAAEKIRRIGVISDITGLVGGILLLAGSIARGQFSRVGTALENIQRHNTALKTLKTGLPAKT